MVTTSSVLWTKSEALNRRRWCCCAKNTSSDGTSVGRHTLTRRCMYSGSSSATFRIDSCALTAPASGDDRGKSSLPLLLASNSAGLRSSPFVCCQNRLRHHRAAELFVLEIDGVPSSLLGVQDIGCARMRVFWHQQEQQDDCGKLDPPNDLGVFGDLR